MSEHIEVVDYPSDCGVHAEVTEWVPADQKSNLCTACREDLASSLLAIESCWAQAVDALQRGRGGGDSERMGGSDIHPPLPINADASDAMRLARDAVWSGAHQLVMDRDHVRLPDDQSTPALAGWLARWHLEHLASHSNGSWTVEWYTEIQLAAEAMLKASLNGVVELPTGAECRTRLPRPDPKKAALGPMCGGQLIMVEQADGNRTVKCSENPDHMLDADSWFLMMAARKPRASRAKNTVIKRLNGCLT